MCVCVCVEGGGDDTTAARDSLQARQQQTPRRPTLHPHPPTPHTHPLQGPVYALAKGVALAGVSAYAELLAPGVALNAALLTLSTAGSLLFALRTGLIRVTDQFSDAVRAVTGGFFLTMMATFLLQLVGVRLPGLFASGPVAVGVGLVSAGLAAANLLLDFDFARQAARSKSVPKKLEWYFAQSTLFTLVWMYMSALRLLMLLSGARDE